MNSFVSLCRRLRGQAPRAAFALLAFGIGSAALAATPPPAGATPGVPDTMQQRVAACASCHGAHGEGSANDVAIPRLAGKPAGYLLQQLEYFQSGQRRHAPMEYVVRQLSPAYLRDIAAYFAQQDVPYRRQPVPAVSAETLRRGEQLVLRGDSTRGVPSCVSCHGDRLTGVEPMMPGLMGLSYDYLTTQLVSWRTRQRAAEGPYCMGVVANRMRESDIAAVSAWLAGQEPPADMHPVPASAHTEPLPGWCVMGKSGAGQ
jgi:cytochrome c553